MKKILILAANPKNTDQLRLDKEVREIEEGLQRSRHREQFELISKWAVRSRDFYRYMLDIQPQIVHFSGHGGGEHGIVLEDEADKAQFLPTEQLAAMFKLFADRGLECVMLNACYSEKQADAVSQHVNSVIGMSKAIGDKAAINFAVAFYDALGAGETINFAFDLACTQIIGLKEHETPRLLSKGLEKTQTTLPLAVENVAAIAAAEQNSEEQHRSLVASPVPHQKISVSNKFLLIPAAIITPLTALILVIGISKISSQSESSISLEVDPENLELKTKNSTSSSSANSQILSQQPVLQPATGDQTESMYERLEAYLKWEEWREADRQTFFLMHEIGKIEELPLMGEFPSFGLIPSEIHQFPCSELERINSLWNKYSNGQFGFDIQLQAIQANGDTTKAIREDTQAYRRLAIRLGWWKTGSDQSGDGYVSYDDFNFSVQAPRGHLPFLQSRMTPTSLLSHDTNIFSRAELCGL